MAIDSNSKSGPHGDSNPGPPAPKAGIIPLDHAAWRTSSIAVSNHGPYARQYVSTSCEAGGCGGEGHGEREDVVDASELASARGAEVGGSGHSRACSTTELMELKRDSATGTGGRGRVVRW